VPRWSLRGDRLERDLRFPDFPAAVRFLDDVAGVAQEQDHHPDLLLRYRDLRVTFWTHTVGGLSENDFIMAAKVDRLPGLPA
jgi:4a-hydroxytetrahydrobiopterin dehydratase